MRWGHEESETSQMVSGEKLRLWEILANAFVGDVVRGAIGFAIAGALPIYLLSGKVRAAFMWGAETLK
jgi:hypothetical protein